MDNRLIPRSAAGILLLSSLIREPFTWRFALRKRKIAMYLMEDVAKSLITEVKGSDSDGKRKPRLRRR
jgi:hypothetical protein